MGGKVRWSREATRDQREILNYWSNRNKSDRYSIELKRMIHTRCEKILNARASGTFMPERHTSNPLVSWMMVRDYKLYYTIVDNDLLVLRIRDGRRDPGKEPY